MVGHASKHKTFSRAEKARQAGPYISKEWYTDETYLQTEALAVYVRKCDGLIVFLSLLNEERLLTQILLHVFLRCWTDHSGLNSCR